MAKKESTKKTAKTSAKKTTTVAKKAPKKQTAKTVLNPIDGKAVGRNVILIIDGQKVSKAFKEKTDRDFILAEVEKYNKKPTLKQQAVILEFMLKDVSTEAQRKEAVKSKAVVKEVAEPKKVKAPKITIEEAKAMLEKDGFTVSKVAPQSRRRSGEY